MTNAERDFAPRGKGEAAEDEGAARARSSGHVGNTGVTVTFTVVCYWISEREPAVSDSAVVFLFPAALCGSKKEDPP